MRYIFLIGATLLMISSSVIATSYSPSSTIKALTVGRDHARVQLNLMGSMAPEEICGSASTPTEHTHFILDMSDGQSKEMFSTIITAKATGGNLFFQVIGCHGSGGMPTLPKINHVYLCDQMWCN